MFASRHIPSGAPVCFRYGRKLNLGYLLECGFVPTDSPYEHLVLAGDGGELVGLFKGMLREMGEEEDEGEEGEAGDRGSKRWNDGREGGEEMEEDEEDEGEGGGRGKDAGLLSSVRWAVEEVQKAKERWQRAEEEGGSRRMRIDDPLFDVSNERPMGVWMKGEVDPRALTALAAMWHIRHFNRGGCVREGVRE